MVSVQAKEISHREFSSRFKLIRHERDYHFGEHALMRDAHTRRRAIVKQHEYEDASELKVIINDYEKLCQLHENAQHICQFIGFSLQENRGVQSIHLIYDYHQSTLEEEIKSMSLHNQKFTEKDIEVFIACMLKAFASLEEFGFHHLSINSKYVLVENRDAIDLNYSLLFSPFLAGAVEEIRENGANVEDYNLSESQLNQMNSQEPGELPFSENLRTDKQSLGLMALRMATSDISKAKLYQMNEKFQLTWDTQNLKLRLDYLIHNYSKSLFSKIQYLIFDRAFYSFRDIPIFPTNTSPFGSASRRKKLSLSKSRNQSEGRNFLMKSPESQKEGNKSFHESRLSRINEASYLSSVFKLQRESLESSRQKMYELSLSTKVEHPGEKLSKYERILYEIEQNVFSQLSEQSKHKKNLEDGSLYIGNIKANRRSGVGICYFKEGDVYGGEWVDDLMDGKGTYLFQNGDHYNGEVSKGTKIGKGRYLFANGNWYDGEWKADRRDGFGIYQSTHGERYEGTWKEGQKNGQGVFTWENGDKYEGCFERGLKHGRGCVTKLKGTKIEGKWRDDILIGIATMNFRNGSQYTGEVNREMQMHGAGQETTAEGVNFEGQYENGVRRGKCRVTYPNGDRYEGQMKDDKFDGFGSYYYAYMDSRYIGTWSKGLQHGKGCLQLAGGTVIESVWTHGKFEQHGVIKYGNGDRYEGGINGVGRNGVGRYVDARGRAVEGLFKNGVLIEQ